MGSVYWKLLLKIESSGFRVFEPSLTRLGKASKLCLILQAWWRHATHATTSTYGNA